MNIYRIIQEGVNNALKYAEASQISVNLKSESSQYIVSISDNGKGFNEETVEIGNGLSNIRKRAEVLKGTAIIQSKPAEGTNIEVRF